MTIEHDTTVRIGDYGERAHYVDVTVKAGTTKVIGIDIPWRRVVTSCGVVANVSNGDLNPDLRRCARCVRRREMDAEGRG